MRMIFMGLGLSLVLLLGQCPVATTQDLQDMAHETTLTLPTVILIYKLAGEYAYHPELLLGLIQKESAFDPRAVNTNDNGTKDHGLGQLNDNTAPWLWAKVFDVPYDERELYNPLINVYLTAWYLNHLLHRNDGDLHRSLTAYNRGQTGMLRLPSPVTGYSQEVIRNFENFMRVYIK